jgi:glycosyltransferase involved in cell wall biosynthesis
MERSPVISVLVPAYNAAPFLREAIASILGQTERAFEIVLIDDGSTDATAEIARELCAADSRIRYFSHENRGIVATLNRGLELCRGEFIARMDADDVSRGDRLEKQLELLRKHPEVVICGSDALRFGQAKGRIRKPRSDRACRAWLLLDPPFVHPGVMFRRSVVDAGLRYRPAVEFAEDYDFWCQVAALGAMRNIPQPLLFYRFHAGQITSTRRARQQCGHVATATAQLAQSGIVIEPAALQAMLWPEQSDRGRWRILLSTWGLFLRMATIGKFVPYLMLAISWNILRCPRRKPPSAATPIG